MLRARADASASARNNIGIFCDAEIAPILSNYDAELAAGGVRPGARGEAKGMSQMRGCAAPGEAAASGVTFPQRLPFPRARRLVIGTERKRRDNLHG